MSAPLATDDRVIIVERDGRNRSTRFHGTRAGSQLHACSQLVSGSTRASAVVTVAQARERDKLAARAVLEVCD